MKWPLWVMLSGCTAASGPMLVPPLSLPDGRTGRRGEVVLRCVPSDAEVALDGVPQGTCSDFDGSSRGLKVNGGQHRVAVKKQGYAPWESWLDASQTQVTLSVNLISTGESSR